MLQVLLILQVLYQINMAYSEHEYTVVCNENSHTLHSNSGTSFIFFSRKTKIDQRFSVLTAVFLSIQVFWDMTLYWVSGS
jgi:hypothetical protein